MRSAFAAAVVALGLMNSAALAQSGPTQPMRAQAPNGVFVWTDASWWSVHLPKYGLGLHNVGPASTDGGLIQSYDPRPNGASVSGGVGFVLPNGTFSSAFGSNVRVTVGGSFLRATASQSAATSSFDSVVQLVDGMVILRCALPVPCQISSRLDTTHRAWRTETKLASDYRAGSAIITPSIAVLGGASRTNQTFFQQRDDTRYNASSEMKWTDWGAKFSVGATLPLMTGLEIGVSGNLGVVHRNASLLANDFGDNAGAVFFSSSLNTNATTAALLAGAAVELVARPTAGMTVRTFAGLDYDSRVPGISSPTFTPANLVTTVGTPARIAYASEVSYFVGGGLTVRFDP